jgi:signal transduction histidine kinase
MSEAPLLGDGQRLRLMIVNLLLNAVEAAAEGRSEAQPAEVVISVTADDANGLELEFIDTGAGPADAVRDTLFDPFVSQKRDGVGLGLSVARDVAEEHGGSIRWTRRDGRTCFRVTLPSRISESARRRFCTSHSRPTTVADIQPTFSEPDRGETVSC